jgi:hypothetical protein
VNARARLVPVLSAALAVASLSGRAWADSTDACLKASDEGQVLRDQGKLKDARARFVTCSRDACPRLVRADCATWLADADTRLPSVVLSARDAAGHDTADVKVTLDGAPLTDHLEPRALPLDPGTHHFHFEIPGAPPIEETVILREGELRRSVSVRFAPQDAKPTPPGPTRPTAGTLAGAITLGALAAAGGAVFAALAASAKSDADHLRSTCAPGCNPSDVSSIRTRLIVANTSLGVGVAALAAGIAVGVWGPREAAAVSVVPGGAVLRVMGRF